MNIVFFGTPEFAIPSLKAIIDSGCNLSMVVTNPDKKSGRGLKNTSSPVGVFCKENSINYTSYLDFSSNDTYNELKKINADLFVVVAFKILPEKIINIPRHGSINIHPSLLPKYRGSSPIQHALLNGDQETGVTIFKLSSKVDSGNIILQKKYLINDRDNFSSLYTYLSQAGANLLIRSIELIKTTQAEYIPQDISSNDKKPILYAKKIKTEDCMIKWDSGSTQINNQIRAFSRKPGAFTYLNNKKIKILEASIFKDKYSVILKPSFIMVYDGFLLVGTQDFPLKITLLQFEGKKMVTGKDFTNSNLFNNDKKLNFE